MSDTCIYCDEAIAPEDAQERIWYIGTAGETSPCGGWRAVHFECRARTALGSVGHQMKQCSCHGGSQEDPPGLTKREAAKAAVTYALTHHHEEAAS